MTEPDAPAQGDVVGAIGVPIGVLAVLLACIPVLGVQISWPPALVAVALGAVGLWRNRVGRGKPRLSLSAVILGAVSLVITAGWFALWVFIQIASE